MDRWAAAKARQASREYRRVKNVRSIDGLETGLLEEAEIS